MKRKVSSYLGFAKKAGKLQSGMNTVKFAMMKGKATLIIIAEDVSLNTEKKIMKEIRKYGTKYVKYGKSDELSHAVGTSGRNIFALCDKDFTEVILKELDSGEK